MKDSAGPIAPQCCYIAASNGKQDPPVVKFNSAFHGFNTLNTSSMTLVNCPRSRKCSGL